MATHTMQLANGALVTIDVDNSTVTVTNGAVERLVYGIEPRAEESGDGADAGGDTGARRKARATTPSE